MLVFTGHHALSDFRQEKYLKSIQSVFPGCHSVMARHLYFLDVIDVPNPQQIGILEHLLEAEATTGTFSLAVDSSSDQFVSRIVVPRIGTISPWSTKATDILHHCGMKKVRRVERGVNWIIGHAQGTQAMLSDEASIASLESLVFDPMTESVLSEPQHAVQLFEKAAPRPLAVIDILANGFAALQKANTDFGFALSEPEQYYLVEQFTRLGRNPTDVELMMFAQVNSEHCRHKIFNADWTIDGVCRPNSLFSMIRQTHAINGAGTLTAYSDNAAVIEGKPSSRFSPDPVDRVYRFQREPVHFTVKVETHNHPTAISPFPGAATGSGGEIRDEGATGRGGKPKAGLVGYTVSHLRIPDFQQPWEQKEMCPDRIASPLQIMLEGPIGAASFNNEFGRPNITGYFRTFESAVPGVDNTYRLGYHKPIMLAGGLGNIREQHVKKQAIPPGAPIVVLGGATMLIGLGGGAASSVASGESTEWLDFASVQRGNPEMQRRCQEVIDSCCAMGKDNPILSIHDVGAGGLCNALPELMHDAGKGGQFELRAILNDEPGMSPLQIWCNESQERYVLAIDPAKYAQFERLCLRERCLFARVGTASQQPQLVLNDDYFDHPDHESGQLPKPIDLPLEVLFGLPPKMHRKVASVSTDPVSLSFDDLTIMEATKRVLSFPTVADKTFLVTIGDRSVTGLVARDQMVGPWQVPVSNVAVTLSGYTGYSGEAMAIGERTPLAAVDTVASGRMAIGEALTNIAAAAIGDLKKVKLSANWMVAAGEPGQDADLYETVQSVALDLCPKLGISIPVGKDSMSMKSVWQADNRQYRVVSPVSLVVSAFASVTDVRHTLTPEIKVDCGQTGLWLIDLGEGKNRLGASVLAQVTRQLGDQVPNVDEPGQLKTYFSLIQQLHQSGRLLAYHDRSDGGLMTTLCEMAFAGRCGLNIDLQGLGSGHLELLFSEELGAVIQFKDQDQSAVTQLFAEHGLSHLLHYLGIPTRENLINISVDGVEIFSLARTECHRLWSQVTWRMQSIRDNPVCADQEYERLLDVHDPGLRVDICFDPDDNLILPYVNRAKPKVAILREQGVNGQLEMAAAFTEAGFEAIDVSMSDLVMGQNLTEFKGLAACGGFSFGDVLGAGAGWGKSILYNSQLRDTFIAFFERLDTFALGVCNGCQMMSSIKELIPGTSDWPKLVRNFSEQYEARFVLVRVCAGKSIFFRKMNDSVIPVSVAHGEGRVHFGSAQQLDRLENNQQVCLRFVDNYFQSTERYPYNPNGSVAGATGFTSKDGRFTIMMPHPERVLRSATNSWYPGNWGEFSPWRRLFQNARVWVD